MMLYKGLEWLHLEHFEQDIGNIQGKIGIKKQKFQKMVVSKTKSQLVKFYKP